MKLPASGWGPHLSLESPPWPRCSYLHSSSLLTWAVQAQCGANREEQGTRGQADPQEEGAFIWNEKGRIAGRRGEGGQEPR